MDEAINETQTRALASAMDHLLKLVDRAFELDEVRLSERPFRATCDLLRAGLIGVSGVEAFDIDEPRTYVAEPWFRAIYLAVALWYREEFGAAALKPEGNPPLKGAIIVRGAPFPLRVPMHRNVLHVERKLSWMYFEAGVGEGEDPRNWIVGGPNLERLDPTQLHGLNADLLAVATSLRQVQHHLLGSGRDPTQRGLRASIRAYLERAADDILAQNAESFAFAWMNLQMAAESALKLIIARATGTHPHTHELDELLENSGAASVMFHPARLKPWPSFKTISNRRYGKDYMAGLPELYDAYKLVLDLVGACVRTIDPPVPSGAGILVHVAPWLIDDPELPAIGPSETPSLDAPPGA